MCGRVPHIIFASTYNSCSTCSGLCTASCVDRCHSDGCYSSCVGSCYTTCLEGAFCGSSSC